MKGPRPAAGAPRPAVAAILLAAATVAFVFVPGCAGNCASNCPNLTFAAAATPGENLDVLTAHWAGAACPAEQPSYCAPDTINGLRCVSFALIGIGEGACQIDLTFKDGRAPFSAVATFGPETHQGCCHGFPVVGANVAVIPPLHPQSGDAGSDAPSSDAPLGAPDTGSLTDSSNREM